MTHVHRRGQVGRRAGDTAGTIPAGATGAIRDEKAPGRNKEFINY
jgi:hypothetical protein